MSETEETNVVPEPAPVAAAPTVDEFIAVVRQLRSQVCSLGIGLLLVSLCFSAFVYKQNRNLRASVEARAQQLKQLQEVEQRALPALKELAGYSAGKPELTALFAKYGMKIGGSDSATPAPPPPIAP